MSKKKNKKKNNHNIRETAKREVLNARDNAEIKEDIQTEAEIEIEETAADAVEIESAEEAVSATDAAEVGVSEIEASETEVPEAEEPEIEVPEAEASEAEAPEIEASEIEVSEIEAPEVEAAETEAPEIEAPEAEAAETAVEKDAVSEINVAEIEALGTALDGFAIDYSDKNETDAEIDDIETENIEEYAVEIEDIEEYAAETDGIEEYAVETDDAKADDIDDIVPEVIYNNNKNAGVNTAIKEKPKPVRRPAKNISKQARFVTVSGLKILLSAAICIVVIAAIVSFVLSRKDDSAGDDQNQAKSIDEPLQENAYENVNEFIAGYFNALSAGDVNTITELTDYVDDTSLITYEKRSEFIEAYTNITCYTKPGLEENSYFVYATYDAKVNDIDTVAPGLIPLYVYTTQDGSLKIDGDRDERVEAAFKLVTNQDDVVDLYNRIDVKYKEVVASDEALKTFMEELPGKVKTSVGEALAQIEGQNGESASTAESETGAQGNDQNQAQSQRVRATATVNVRKSDSEEADRIGKITPGTELTRVEEKVNGWSKVIYEGKEAYIKSNYLEAVSTDTAEAAGTAAGGAEAAGTAEGGAAAAGTADGGAEPAGTPIGSVKAKTNVNVRSDASQDSQKLGVALAGKSYDLLEKLGEWYKIKYNGKTGYVKAEFFMN